MKKIIFILLFVFSIIILLITFILKSNKESYITNYDNLYDVAIKYLESNDNDYYKEESDYKLFISHKDFGITEDNKYKYAYMWILIDSYYVKDNKLYRGSASSMPYKFTFKDNKVVKYDIPKDGTYYTSSIKEMFPKNLCNKILNYDYEELNLQNDIKVKEHYSYLNSTEINY